MADDRSVDMGESRPTDPATDPARPTGLSPLQQAWKDYTSHTAGCPRCRTTDGGRCADAARLWAAHRDLCDQAYAALAAERGRA
jgi:hypothetical protein